MSNEYQTAEEARAEVLRLKKHRREWAALVADLRQKLEAAEKGLLDLRPSRWGGTTMDKALASFRLAEWRAAHGDNPAPVWAVAPRDDNGQYRIASVTAKSVMVWSLDRMTDKPARYSRETGMRGKSDYHGVLDVAGTLALWGEK